ILDLILVSAYDTLCELHIRVNVIALAPARTCIAGRSARRNRMRRPPPTPEHVPRLPSPDPRASARTTSGGVPWGARWLPTWLGRDLALLFGGRALRSLAQGYLAIIVPLFL